MNRLFNVLFCFLFFLAIFGYYQPTLLFAPQSHISDHGDAIINYWMLAHGLTKISSFSFSTFWDGNIFFPLSLTMALSDTLLFQVLFILPFHLLGVPLIVAYNLSIAVFFAFCGVFSFLLMFELVESFGLALLGSSLATVNAFWFSRIAHYQLLPVFFYPLSLMFLLHYYKRQELKSWIFHSLSLVGLGLASPYLFLLFMPALGIIYAVLVIQTQIWKRTKDWLQLGMILGFSLMLVGVYYWPYLQIKNLFGLVRKTGEQALYSASWPAFSSHEGLTWPTHFLGPDHHYGEGQIYLSWIIRTLIPLSCFLLLLPKFRKQAASCKPYLGLALVLLIVFVLAALGPEARPHFLNVWRKFNYIPGFTGIRVPARVGFQIYLYAAAVLVLSLKILKFQKFQWFAAPLILAFLIFEMKKEVAVGQEFQDESSRGLVQYIISNKRPDPAVFYPIDENGLDFFVIAAQVNNHFLNGRSGFTPAIHEQFIFPNITECTTHSCLYLLNKIGIKLIIVRKGTSEMQAVQNFLEQTMKVLYEDKFYVLLENSSLRNEKTRDLTSEKILLTERPQETRNLTCNQEFAAFDSHDTPIASLSDQNLVTRWTSSQPQGPGVELTLIFRRPVLGHFTIQLIDKSEKLAAGDFARKPKVTAFDSDLKEVPLDSWIDISQNNGNLSEWLDFNTPRPVSRIKIEARSIPANNGWWSIGEVMLCI